MPPAPEHRARLQATVAVVIALGLWLWVRGLFATCVLSVAAVLAALAWIAPRAHAPVQRTCDRIARGLAVGLSWMVLALTYIGMFVPLRVWRAALGHDPLGRRRDARATTYLQPLRPPRPDRFRRMY